MGLKYELNKKKDNEFFLIQGYKKARFFIKIDYSEDWIKTYCLVLPAELIDDYKRFPLYTELLLQNKIESDLTYSIDEEGNVYSENDCPASANYESFKSEYKMAIKGIHIILEKICPKIELTLVDTTMGIREVK